MLKNYVDHLFVCLFALSMKGWTTQDNHFTNLQLRQSEQTPNVPPNFGGLQNVRVEGNHHSIKSRDIKLN